MSGLVRTVLGDVEPGELGVTYVHEHLLTEPRAGQGADLRLDDEDRMATELERFREAGGGAVLEATTPEFGRSAAGLRRLSERTGVHVVAITGHQHEAFWRGVLDLDALDEEALTEALVGDLTEGMDGSEVRAGAVKVGSSLGEITATERKVIRAGAAAQQRTGAPIVTHTTAGTVALAQVQTLERAGADLSRVCIGHLDRRLVWDEHLALARTGVFLGYDQISKEKYAPDRERARFVVRLAEEGYADRIVMGGDLARRGYHPSYGGAPGLTYLLEGFLPILVGEGLSEQVARSLLVDNPARLLAWAAT